MGETTYKRVLLKVSGEALAGEKASSITSAPISAARSTAAVSVEKKGLPLPPPKRTTRPFSRWRTGKKIY